MKKDLPDQFMLWNGSIDIASCLLQHNDDDSFCIAASNKALAKLLKKHGHEILTAKDGAEGVEVAKAEIPDLVLMDVVMPKINGFQATRQITKNPSTSHIPVIIVTTKDQETDRIWGERQGAKGYVTKPVDEETLFETINKFLTK